MNQNSNNAHSHNQNVANSHNYTTGNTTTIQGEEISDILTESSIPVNNTKQALPFIVMMKNMMDFYMKNPEMQQSMDQRFQSMIHSQIASYASSKPENSEINEKLAVRKNLTKAENCRSVPNFENFSSRNHNNFNSASGFLNLQNTNKKFNMGHQENCQQEKKSFNTLSARSKENKFNKSPSSSEKKKNSLNVVHNYSNQSSKLVFKKKNSSLKKNQPSAEKTNKKIFSSLNKYNVQTDVDSLADFESQEQRGAQTEHKENLIKKNFQSEQLDLDLTQSLRMKPEPMPKSPNRITKMDLRFSTEGEKISFKKKDITEDVYKVLQDEENLIQPEYQNKSVEGQSQKKTGKLEKMKEKMSQLKKRKMSGSKEMKVAKCLFDKEGNFEKSFEETLVFENSNKSYRKPNEEEEARSSGFSGEKELPFDDVELKEVEIGGLKSDKEEGGEEEKIELDYDVEHVQEKYEKEEEILENPDESEKLEEKEMVKEEVITLEEEAQNLNNPQIIDIPISKPKITPKKKKILEKVSTMKKIHKNQSGRHKRSKSVYNPKKKIPPMKKSTSRSYLRKGQGIGGGKFKKMSRSRTARQLGKKASTERETMRGRSRNRRRGSISFREDSRGSRSAYRVKDYINEYKFENNKVQVLREDMMKKREDEARVVENFDDKIFQEEKEKKRQEIMERSLKKGLKFLEEMRQKEEEEEGDTESGFKTEREDSLEASLKSRRQKSLNLCVEEEEKLMPPTANSFGQEKISENSLAEEKKILEEKKKFLDQEVKKFENYVQDELKKFEDYKFQEEENIQKRKNEQDEKLKLEEAQFRRRLKNTKAKQMRLVKEEKKTILEEAQKKAEKLKQRDQKEIERLKRQLIKKDKILKSKEKKIILLEKENEKNQTIVEEKDKEIINLQKKIKELELKKKSEIDNFEKEISSLKKKLTSKIEIENFETRKKKQLEVKLINSLNTTDPISLPKSKIVQNHEIVIEDPQKDNQSDCESLLSKKYENLKKNVAAGEIPSSTSPKKQNHFSLVKIIKQTPGIEGYDTVSYNTASNVELITEDENFEMTPEKKKNKFKLNIDSEQYNYDANQYYQEYLEQEGQGFEVVGEKFTETGKKLKIFENGKKQVVLKNGAVKEVYKFF